jgi:hypothetical protein
MAFEGFHGGRGHVAAAAAAAACERKRNQGPIARTAQVAFAHAHLIGVHMDLAAVSPPQLKEVVRMAWRHMAPREIAADHERHR